VLSTYVCVQRGAHRKFDHSTHFSLPHFLSLFLFSHHGTNWSQSTHSRIRKAADAEPTLAATTFVAHCIEKIICATPTVICARRSEQPGFWLSLSNHNEPTNRVHTLLRAKNSKWRIACVYKVQVWKDSGCHRAQTGRGRLGYPREGFGSTYKSTGHEEAKWIGGEGQPCEIAQVLAACNWILSWTGVTELPPGSHSIHNTFSSHAATLWHYSLQSQKVVQDTARWRLRLCLLLWRCTVERIIVEWIRLGILLLRCGKWIL